MIKISKEKNELDESLIHQFLTNSYWAKGRTFAEVKTSIANSFCYGIYSNDQQIGFARVISDTVVFAYLMDVFIIETERGKGYAQNLMYFVLNDNNLRGVKQWYLKTNDAHKFYEKFEFQNINSNNMFMEKIREVFD